MASPVSDDVKYGHGHQKGVHVTVFDHVAVLTMKFGENRFNQNMVRKMEIALDDVERNPDVHALVVMGEGKYFSTGMDLPWMKYMTQTNQTHEVEIFLREKVKLVSRILTFPIPTVAVLNGHAVAAGALFALCFDVRVMRKDRGFFFINEVHINMSVTGMSKELVSTKIPNGQAFTEAVVFGKRLTGYDTHHLGITSAICEQSELLQTGHKTAKQILADGPFDRKTMKEHKENLYASVLEPNKTFVPYSGNYVNALAKAKM